MSRSSTLKLARPFGHTLIISLGIFLVLVISGELSLHNSRLQAILGARSLGSAHRGLEEQIAALEKELVNRNQIDCVIVGNSTVMTDFAPRIFEQAYQEQTGKEITCFNLGVGASMAASTVALAQLLAQEYRPGLLIFGLQALDFAVPAQPEGAEALLDTPWLVYKLGQPSAEGWLYEHSYLYSYRHALRKLVRFEIDLRSILSGTPLLESSGLSEGYYPFEGQGPFEIDQPPDPDSKHPYDENYFGSLGNFGFLAENLQALEQFAELQSDTTELLVIETPVADTFIYYYGNDEQDHRVFLDTVAEQLSAHGVAFWPTTGQQLFSTDNWYNRNHLNVEGARIFSEWLGRQVGQAALNESSLGETWIPIQ